MMYAVMLAVMFVDMSEPSSTTVLTSFVDFFVHRFTFFITVIPGT